jgi:hypothetical protein
MRERLEITMATTRSKPTVRELARRLSDGIDVRLFWDSREDRLMVSVLDGMTGEFFELPAPREAALEVFNHPYAYAA